MAGGLLVVVFALIGEVVAPKAFSGLFSSAPSVAIASLAITLITEGASKAHQDSVGMSVGTIAMAGCCVLATAAIPRIHALWGSLVAWMGWSALAMGLYWAVFVGAH